MTRGPGTTPKYFRCCSKLLPGTHRTGLVGHTSVQHRFLKSRYELLAWGAAVAKGVQLGTNRQTKRSPMPLTAARPHAWVLAVVPLPNRYVNRTREKRKTKNTQTQPKTLRPHRSPNKERNPYREAEEKNAFCSTAGAEKKCIINNWKSFHWIQSVGIEA